MILDVLQNAASLRPPQAPTDDGAMASGGPMNEGDADFSDVMAEDDGSPPDQDEGTPPLPIQLTPPVLVLMAADGDGHGSMPVPADTDSTAPMPEGLAVDPAQILPSAEEPAPSTPAAAPDTLLSEEPTAQDDAQAPVTEPVAEPEADPAPPSADPRSARAVPPATFSPAEAIVRAMSGPTVDLVDAVAAQDQPAAGAANNASLVPPVALAAKTPVTERPLASSGEKQAEAPQAPEEFSSDMPAQDQGVGIDDSTESPAPSNDGREQAQTAAPRMGSAEPGIANDEGFAIQAEQAIRAIASDVPGTTRAGTLLPAPAPQALPIQTSVTTHATGIDLRMAIDDMGALRMEFVQSGDRLHIAISADRPELLDLVRRHADLLATEMRQSGLGGTDISFGNWNGMAGDRPAGRAVEDAPLSSADETGAAQRPGQGAADAGRMIAPGTGQLNLRL